MLHKYLSNQLQLNKLAQSWIINSTNPEKSLDSLKDFVKDNMCRDKTELEYHPDFYLVQINENSKNILIEQVRGLQQFLYKKSAMEGIKIVVIYEADLMNLNAANSCLKILEEPPKDSYIFLITARAESLIPTIKSRCAKYEDNYTSWKPQDQQLEYEKFLDLVINNDSNTKLEILKSLKNKDRELFKLIADYIYQVFSIVIKKSVTNNDKELAVIAKFSTISTGKLIDKFNYISELISNTIEYDLDLSASFVVLLDELM